MNTVLNVPLISGIFAFVAFATVVAISDSVLGVSLSCSQTVYALAMGVLGSSLYLLYNLIGVLDDHKFSELDVPRNIARLFLGPVAGWLAYFMWVSADPSSNAPPTEASQPAIAGTTQIWLPFLAGFSSDLLIGIINQGIRAIKFTLGINQVGQRER